MKDISARIKIIGWIMTCIIVVYHCSPIKGLVPVNELDASLSRFIILSMDKAAEVAMAWFFCITGFLFFKDIDANSIKKKILRRIHSLLIPYVVWNLFALLFSFFTGERIQIFDFLHRVFFFKEWPQDGPTWYMYMVFLLALLSPVFFRLFSKRSLACFLISSSVLIIWSIMRDTDSALHKVLFFGYLGNTMVNLPAYLVGGVLRVL